VRIDLSRVTEEPVGFVEELEVVPERLDASEVAAPVRARLSGEVRPVGGGFAVSGTLEASGSLTCVRCLTAVPWQTREAFAFELSHTIVGDASDEIELDEDDLDRVQLVGDELDLDDIAAEQILLALPMRVVCRDDCAGLCPSCGANRNLEGACHCEPEPDPRWAALRDLSERPS
jgi:uncharacterized protein